MGKEIYNIINDMAEVLNASQMQKLQEELVNRLSENNTADYLHTGNDEFLDMFLTAKHLEGCSDKTIRYYRCNIEKMLETINIPVVKITTEMLRKYLVEYQLQMAHPFGLFCGAKRSRCVAERSDVVRF